MKNILTIIFINFFIFTHTFAEWGFVTTLQDGKDTKVYTDIETFRKDTNYSYIWELQDLTVPFKGTKSSAMQLQIDCKLMRYKILQFVFYDGQMATGNPKPFARDVIKWKYAPPGAFKYNLMKGVCKY